MLTNLVMADGGRGPFAPSKIVCVAKNYAAHAAELASSVPTQPTFFIKPNSCLCDFAGPLALPTGRGFDSFYGYWTGAETHFSHFATRAYDFADQTETCLSVNGTYGTRLFAKRAVEIIEGAKASRPFFLYLALQNVHWPLEAPAEYLDRFANTTGGDKRRQAVAAMASIADEGESPCDEGTGAGTGTAAAAAGDAVVPGLGAGGQPILPPSSPRALGRVAHTHSHLIVGSNDLTRARRR